MNSFENIITKIENGGLPYATGLHFSQAQINEIETLLESRKTEIDNYFNNHIRPKLDQSENTDRELRKWVLTFEHSYSERILDAIEFLKGCEDLAKGKELWLMFRGKNQEKLRAMQDFIETGSEASLVKGL